MRFLTFLYTCLTCLTLFAVPAHRSKRLLTLADGTRIWATMQGNSEFYYYVTDDGLHVVPTEDGLRLISDDVQFDSLRRAVSEKARVRHAAPRRIGSAATAALKQHGTKYVPVVLTQFADLKFTVKKTEAELRDYYDLFCNGTRDGVYYTGHGSTGSVRDYFVSQSDSAFMPVFVVIGPVTLDHPYAYYGADSGASLDLNYNEFVNESVRKALPLRSDWTMFDNDNDGKVDMIFTIFAGMAQSYGGDDNTIWPKDSPFSLTVDGVRFASSATTCELCPAGFDDSGNVTATKADGVGVFIHELSHALGLPDFYDTKNVAFGMDYWSVMDYGEYVNNGFSPCGYTAYERDFMGWRQLETLSGPCTLRLRSFAEGGKAYRIPNPSSPNEYYVLENRQKTGWDNYLCRLCTGLQVTHVDFSQSLWDSNRVNTDAKHQRMTIIAANNTYKGSNSATSLDEYLETIRGNLFPGKTQNHELTDETTPASIVYTGGYMSKPICDITEWPDGTLTLKFCPEGILPSVSNLRCTESSASDLVAEWDAVANATTYRVELFCQEELVQWADSVTATTFRFTGLAPQQSYTFSVTPQNDTWLNGESVTAVAETLADGIISPAASTQTVSVYGLDGTLLGQCRGHEIHRLAQHCGIYVVLEENGQASKILIK